MAKFQKGNPGGPGRPKGLIQTKKIVKVAEFCAANNINIAKMWYDAILEIDKPVDKAAALAKYYQYVGGVPKQIDDAVDVQVIEVSEDKGNNILSIIKSEPDGNDNGA